MSAYDIVNDEAYKIDKATGASTLLGSIGYDANYAQGMGWDPVEDIVYLAAYNNDGSGGQLRILDRETGNTALVGGFAAGGEIDALGFPGGGGGNWASIEPSSGTIEATGSQDVTVTFDGNYVPPQKDLTVTGVLKFSTDPDVGSPEVALSMTITGSFFGILEGTVTHDGTPVEGVTVTATRQESPIYTYTMVTGADGMYSFPTALYGTYDFTAEKVGFNPFTSTTPAVVVGEQTTVYDIAMTAPIMVVEPTSITAETPFGTIITRTITVQNTGDGTLEWFADSHETPPPANIYATDFESFVAGTQVACQDPVNWTTWSNAPCGPEDGMVSTDYAASPVKSVKIDGTNDLVLLMGNKTSGKYEYTFNMYVPANFCGYYNLLQSFAGASSEWGFEAYFHTDGTGYINAGGNTAASFDYAHDVWMPVKNMVDLDNDLAEFYLNGVLIHTWQWSLGATGTGGLNQLGATDFFAGAEGSDVPTYYFDDIVYKVADAKRMVNIPASDGKFPRGTAAPSIGRAPAGATVNPASPIPADVRASLGYACDIYPGLSFFSFMTDNPGTPTVISTLTNEPYGGTFDAVNTDFYYVIDYGTNTLQTMDLATGTVTNIGSCAPFGAESWTGLAVDKSTNIMYGISTDISESHIYTIDMATGASTVIGATGIPGAIDCAIDGTGQMYAYDIVNDEAYKIDKATGASTLLGSIGYDANYAQGMGWDPVEDIIYLAAYNNDGSGGQLRILDRETGNTTLVGGFFDGGEIDALGFPGGGGPQWLTIDPKTGIIPAGATGEVTVTLDGNYVPPQKDFTLFGEVTFTSDPDVGTINVPITFTILGDLYGILEGVVSHGGVGVADATVTAVKTGTAPYIVTTGADGHFMIDPILGGTYDVTVEAVGYNPYATTGVVITPPATTTLNVELTAPMMIVTPGSLTVNLMVGQSTDETILVQNTGDGFLSWNSTLVTSKKATFAPIEFVTEPRTVTSPTGEASPLHTTTLGDPIRAMWDLLFSFPSSAVGQAGVETDGQYIYSTSWSVTPTFHKYALDGTWIEDFDIAGVTAIRDLAYDGQYFYGGANASTIYQMDFTNKVLVGTISAGVASVRHIAYDSQSDGFWVGGWSDLSLVNRAGTVISTGNPGLTGMYGTAYDPYSAGGPFLWIFDQGGNGVDIQQYNIAAGSLTGVMHDASDVPGFISGSIAGGLCLNTDLIAGKIALIGLIQQDIIFGYDLGEATAPWITRDPTSGELAAGASQQVTVHLDATELAVGQYNATITYTSEPNVGTVTVPVTLNVSPFGGPTLTITEVYNAPAGAVSVPVHAEEIVDMGSFQFTLDYNAAYLTYTGVSNWYPGISDVLINDDIPGKLTFVWAASDSGITINDATFFNLDFAFNGTLDWAWIGWSDDPTPREFADWDGNIINPVYNNGFVTGHGVGVPETGAQAIKVYPNPASDLVNVKSDFTIKNIEVLSYLGQIVYSENNLNTKLVQFNVSSLNSGVYFVKINTSDGVKTTKITVKR